MHGLDTLETMMKFICGYIQENWDRYMKDIYVFVENIINGNIQIELDERPEELAYCIVDELNEEYSWNGVKQYSENIVENQLSTIKIDSVMELFNQIKQIDDELTPSEIIRNMVFIWPLINGQIEIPDLCVPCFDIIDFNLVSADDTDGIKQTIYDMQQIRKRDYFKCCDFYELSYLRINAIRIGIDTHDYYSGKDYSNILDYIDEVDSEGEDIEEGDEYD